MLQVECINASNTAVLEVGKVYYAFPLPGGKAAYISRFPDKNSHTGCFQLSRFIKTDKTVSTFYSTNSIPKVRVESEFKKGCYYLAKLKGVAEQYNPYLYVYAISDEILAVYDNETFQVCLGSAKGKSFEGVNELKPPENPGKISLFPVAIKYGFLMEREKITPIEIFREEVVSDSDSSVKIEQLFLF